MNLVSSYVLTSSIHYKRSASLLNDIPERFLYTIERSKERLKLKEENKFFSNSFFKLKARNQVCFHLVLLFFIEFLGNCYFLFLVM